MDKILKFTKNEMSRVLMWPKIYNKIHYDDFNKLSEKDKSEFISTTKNPTISDALFIKSFYEYLRSLFFFEQDGVILDTIEVRKNEIDTTWFLYMLCHLSSIDFRAAKSLSEKILIQLVDKYNL